MKMFVKVGLTNTIMLKVQESDTIFNVKQKTQHKEGVDLAQQMLFFAGSEVNDPCTLLSYTIMNASALHGGAL